MIKTDSAVDDLVVYSREACHLCTQMIQALKECQARLSFDFKVIDIDADPELVSRFNDKIPVLVSPSNQEIICHYHLDMNALDDYLARFR
ncbi:glutaredoxin family protein [Nitrosomonas marina]|uniref:Glutaredoxin-like domain n=1 Tax=Nitrosomonas marina TaxID=917 RepID=A0A1H8DMX2_9PROT|nr:glutaredoxin family protein [Nitrosomonas marina]SEN08134.1 Glutaredoxin-like domain [Nitrosomonas marina]